MKKIRAAVIGCGAIANSAHIPAYRAMPDAEITYFCDIIPERAVTAAEKYGGTAVFDYKELLGKEDIDIVSVCTPNCGHAPIAIDFLRAGKDVLCEKPASHLLEDALKMQEAQRETGRVLDIGVCNRFSTGVNKIREIISRGELGEVYHVYASFRTFRGIPGLGGAFTTKAIAGGGALIDRGVHFIDLSLYCCGDPAPVSVSGQAFCKLGLEDYTYTSMWAGPPVENGIYDVDDSVTAIVRTNGPVITLHGAWAQNIGKDELYIDFMGTRGGIRLKYGSDFSLYYAKDGCLFSSEVAFASENMYENEIRAFIDSTQSGKKNVNNIDYAISASRIMQAIYDSSESQREIIVNS